MNCLACILQLLILVFLQDDTTRQEEVLKERRLIRVDIAKNMSDLLRRPLKTLKVWAPPIKVAFKPAFQLLVITGVRACPLAAQLFQAKSKKKNKT
jgi:hypothetical protein